MEERNHVDILSDIRGIRSQILASKIPQSEQFVLDNMADVLESSVYFWLPKSAGGLGIGEQFILKTHKGNLAEGWLWDAVTGAIVKDGLAAAGSCFGVAGALIVGSTPPGAIGIGIGFASFVGSITGA